MPGIEHQTFPRLPYRLLSLRVHPGYGALTSGRAPRRDFREFPFIARHHSYIRTARQQCLENRAAKPAATAGSDDRPAIQSFFIIRHAHFALLLRRDRFWASTRASLSE